MPEVSPLVWDAVDNCTVFLPISNFFGVDRVRQAVNANAFDEVPDSSWFQNRTAGARHPRTCYAGLRSTADLIETIPMAWLVGMGAELAPHPASRARAAAEVLAQGRPGGGRRARRRSRCDQIAFYHAAGYQRPASASFIRPELLRSNRLALRDNRASPDRSINRADGFPQASWRDGRVRHITFQWHPTRSWAPSRTRAPATMTRRRHPARIGANCAEAALPPETTSTREQILMTTWIATGP
jgi:hypothetical protein